MADAVVEFLLNNIKEVISYNADLLFEGGVARLVEEEFETLIPQLNSVEGQEPEVAALRKVIPKAEYLAETYTKREIQRNASTFKKPIYAIRALGISFKLLIIKREIDLLKDKIPSLSEPSQHGPQQINQSLLRRCLHYLLLFPPDDPVPARRLLVLWVAEGHVHASKEDDKSVEQVAGRYLNELLHQEDWVHVEQKPGGKVTFKIKAERRDELMREARKEEFLYGSKGAILRLVDLNGSSSSVPDKYKDDPSFILIDGDTNTSSSVPKYKDVLSFLSFNTQEGSKPGEDVGNFLRRCISAGCFVWLKVLDLEKVFRPQLPASLGDLIAMKYLGLRWTYLERLPDSVDKLFNLHVLDVKHTYISVLPQSIWRMMYLRHLYLSEAYRTRFPDPPSKVTLTALQTLWGAFIDEDTPITGGLATLLNIRKLGLSCRPRESEEHDESSEEHSGEPTLDEEQPDEQPGDQNLNGLQLVEPILDVMLAETRSKAGTTTNGIYARSKATVRGIYTRSKATVRRIYTHQKQPEEQPRELTLDQKQPHQLLDEMSQQLDRIDKWISNLKDLESLRLKSRDDNNEAADLRLTSLAGNSKLSTLYLLGKLDSLVICKLPASLTNITLSGSNLDLDPMAFLERLPNLEILRLLGQSVVCSKIFCSKRGFPKLKLLWIWKLEKLEEFEAEEGSLPSLKELEVRSCHKLEKLPDRLRQLEDLEVKLTSMKQEFMKREWIKYAVIQPVSEDEWILRNKRGRSSQYDAKGKQPHL